MSKGGKIYVIVSLTVLLEPGVILKQEERYLPIKHFPGCRAHEFYRATSRFL
jgi:hypothetical protein